MALPRDPFFEAAAARADRVNEVLAPLDEREEHAVPAVSDVGLDCSCELGLAAGALLLQLLQDEVAEFLELDGVVGGELAKDLARVHAGGLVEVTPVARVGQRALELVRTGRSDAGLLGQRPLPRLVDEPGAEGIAVLHQHQEALRSNL